MPEVAISDGQQERTQIGVEGVMDRQDMTIRDADLVKRAGIDA